MSGLILVTYATRTGSTVGVAEAIAKVLVERGAQVEVHPMQEVSDLTPYRAVVMGSPIRERRWLPEAMQFVQTNRVALAGKPLATFTVCLTLAMVNTKYHYVVAQWVAPVRSLVKPISEGYFAGVLDISKIPSFLDRIKFRLSVLFGVWRVGDHRDWKAIDAWANTLAGKLNLYHGEGQKR